MTKLEAAAKAYAEAYKARKRCEKQRDEARAAGSQQNQVMGDWMPLREAETQTGLQLLAVARGEE